MLETGVFYNLRVLRKTRVGAYLNKEDGKPADDVLLPARQVPEDINIGDEIRVFVYMDSEDRIISTVNKPKLAYGECGMLQVVQTTKIGAFLDWGLEKDLFLPFDNQRDKIHKGDNVFIRVIRDEKNRLCATTRIYDDLSTDSPYKLNDRVSGTVYAVNPRMGAFVAVDGMYHGLVPVKELMKSMKIGESVNARVTNVRRDGKLELSLRKKAYGEIDDDVKKLLLELRVNKGFLPYGDKSNPNAIKKRFGMSKAAFKRAVGRMLKQGMIEITDRGIMLNKSED